VPTSSYYDYKKHCRKIDAERLTLRSLLKQLLPLMRNAAGSRSLVDMMRELGHVIGRLKVGCLPAPMLSWL
jgi:putative transposase